MKIRPSFVALPITLVAAASALLLANPAPSLAAVSADNPLAPLSGFTVVVNGNSTLGNTEIEGTVAVGGDLSLPHGYNFIHSSGLTPADYELPVVDGDPTRLLIGGRFLTSSSSGVSELSSRGNIRTDQLGYLKVGDTSNLAMNPRGNQGLGVWVSAAGTSAGDEPALYVTDTVAEPQSAVAASGAFSAKFAGAFAALDATGASLRNLSSCTAAHQTQLSAGSNAGQRAIELVAGETNYLSVSAADLAFSEIVFTGAQPDASTPVIFNITGTGAAVTIPRFAAANNTSASSPNPIAPYVLWNFSGVTGPVSIFGDKVSGSILAPSEDVTLGLSSPLEGQLVAGTLSTTGGEIHHYAFQGNVSCLSAGGSTPTGTPTATATPTVTPTPTATATATPTGDPTTAPTTAPTPSASATSDGQLPTLALTDETAANSTLASTGVEALPAVALGAVLVCIGALVVVAGRRRRHG